MQKSFRSTLIMAGLLVAAVLWYTLYEGKLKGQRTEAEENTKKLVSLDMNAIQELDIEHLKNAPPDDAPAGTTKTVPEYEKFKLRKTGNDWNLVEPLAALADGPTVSTMLTTITTTKTERTVNDKPGDLDEYGLKNPLLKITVRKDASSPAQEVLVGRNTPTGFSSYIIIAGKSEVLRASRTMRTAFEKPMKELRDKSVVTIPRFEVGEVEITGPKENLILKKDEKDNWLLTRDNMPADNNEWNKTLNAVVDLKALDFVSENAADAKKFGLNPPEVKVTLTRTKDKARTSLLLGRVGDKAYAKRDDKPTIYLVDKDVLARTERPSAEFRNMQLAIFNRFDISRVKLERGHDTIEFLKDGANWTMPTDPKVKIDNAKVDALLTNLQDVKMAKFTKAGVSNPELTVRVFEKKDKAETEKVALKFAHPKGEETAVERTGMSFPFTIKTGDFTKIDLGRESFISKDDKKVEKKEPTKKS